MENAQIYSNRIINNYIEYLKKYHPDINIPSMLEYAGIAPYEMEDDGHWLTQKQTDLFNEILVEKTNNPHISRDAGRFVVLSGSFHTIRQFMIGFLSPAMICAGLERITTHITRGTTFSAQPIASNSYEVIAIPKPGVVEKPYQCDNRLGLLEGLSKSLTDRYAAIDHVECIHKGGKCCKYIMRWEISKLLVWKKIKRYALVLSPIVLFALYILMPSLPHEYIIFSVLILVLMINNYAEYLEKKELAVTAERQGSAAEQLLTQIEMRYNDTLVIQEIGQATSMILEQDKLLYFIMETLVKRLNYDRGMILLVNNERTRLKCASVYGYTTGEEGNLSNTEFNLDNPRSRGTVVDTFRRQTPAIINNLADIDGIISPRSHEFAKRIGAESFICVPIIYEGESIGILLIDNVRSKRRLTRSDVNLLMGIAPQIGISLKNAITYRKIQESEERFRSLSENSPDIIYTLDDKGRFTHINPAWERILGHKKEDAIGKPFLHFVRKEDTPYYMNVFDRIKNKKETVRDSIGIILHHDRTEKYFNISGAPNFGPDGSVIGIVGTFKDVTELKYSEESYRLFINGTNDMAYLKDDRYRYIFVNTQAARYFNRSETDIIGRTDYDLLPADIAAIYRKSDESALASDGVYVTEETINQHIYQMRKFQIKLINGKTGIGAYIHDNTKGREMESRLLQAQKMEAIGTLAGGIAHDFNNMLMGIQGYTSLLLVSMEKDSPYFDKVLNIQDLVRSGSDLTRQLLGFARKGRIEVKPTNINELIMHTSSMFGRTKKEIRILESYLDDIWTVDIDKGQIEQVLMNLYVNAWQAMPNGGEIRLKTENVVPTNEFLASHDMHPGRYVKISVTDTGIGMTAETRSRIFEPFFTTKEMGRGTGLGLATVYGIINGHNGFIDVDTAPGRGTSFMIYLPASCSELTQEVKEEKPLIKGTETILLVDDEDVIREVTREMLESLGYKVLSADSGHDAILQYKKHKERIELIILDMIMPGMNGNEAYKVLKDINPDVPIILSSGYSADGQAREMMDTGVSAFLQKPYLMQDLSFTIREVIDKDH